MRQKTMHFARQDVLVRKVHVEDGENGENGAKEGSEFNKDR